MHPGSMTCLWYLVEIKKKKLKRNEHFLEMKGIFLDLSIVEISIVFDVGFILSIGYFFIVEKSFPVRPAQFLLSRNVNFHCSKCYSIFFFASDLGSAWSKKLQLR